MVCYTIAMLSFNWAACMCVSVWAVKMFGH